MIAVLLMTLVPPMSLFSASRGGSEVRSSWLKRCLSPADRIVPAPRWACPGLLLRIPQQHRHRVVALVGNRDVRNAVLIEVPDDGRVWHRSDRNLWDR